MLQFPRKIVIDAISALPTAMKEYLVRMRISRLDKTLRITLKTFLSLGKDDVATFELFRSDPQSHWLKVS